MWIWLDLCELRFWPDFRSNIRTDWWRFKVNWGWIWGEESERNLGCIFGSHWRIPAGGGDFRPAADGGGTVVRGRRVWSRVNEEFSDIFIKKPWTNEDRWMMRNRRSRFNLASLIQNDVVSLLYYVVLLVSGVWSFGPGRDALGPFWPDSGVKLGLGMAQNWVLLRLDFHLIFFICFLFFFCFCYYYFLFTLFII